jgi:hypothetical protein
MISMDRFSARITKELIEPIAILKKLPSNSFEKAKAMKEEMVKRQLKLWGSKGLTRHSIADL